MHVQLSSARTDGRRRHVVDRRPGDRQRRPHPDGPRRDAAGPGARPDGDLAHRRLDARGDGRDALRSQLVVGATTGGVRRPGGDSLYELTPTSITVLTPAHAAGPVTVTVTTGGATATLTGPFTYLPPPTVREVSPTSGPAQRLHPDHHRRRELSRHDHGDHVRRQAARLPDLRERQPDRGLHPARDGDRDGRGVGRARRLVAGSRRAVRISAGGGGRRRDVGWQPSPSPPPSPPTAAVRGASDHEAPLQADLAGDRRLGAAARHRRLLVAAHRPGGPAQRAGRERADRRQAGGGLRREPHRQPAVDPAGRRQDLRSDPLLGERESVVGGAAEISAARLSPERRLLRRRHVRRARHADRPAGLSREPEPLRRLQGARGDAADRRRGGRPDGPARRGARRRRGDGADLSGGPDAAAARRAGGRLRSEAGRRAADPGGRGVAQATRELRRLAGQRRYGRRAHRRARAAHRLLGARRRRQPRHHPTARRPRRRGAVRADRRRVRAGRAAAHRRLCPGRPLGDGGAGRQDRRRRAAAGQPDHLGHADLDRGGGPHRIDRGTDLRPAPERSGGGAGRGLAPDRRRTAGGPDRAGGARRAGGAGGGLQPDGRRAGSRRGRRSRSRPTRSRPGTRRWRSGSRTRRPSCARRRTSCSARARSRRWGSWARGWRTRSTIR